MRLLIIFLAKKVFLGRFNATVWRFRRVRRFCQIDLAHKIVFVEAICSPVICADLTNQNCKFVSKQYSHLQGLHLADKSTDGRKAIEILVGLDYYFEFITGEVIKCKYDEPVALKSSFGYILSGQ